MPTHRFPEEATVAEKEPVSVSEVVRMVLVVLISLGWITMDDATTTTVATVLGALLSIAASWWTRRRVTPVTPSGRTPPTSP